MKNQLFAIIQIAFLILSVGLWKNEIHAQTPFTITWTGLTGSTNATGVPTGINIVQQYNGVVGSCSTSSNGATTSYSAVIQAAAGYNVNITSIGGAAYSSSAGSRNFSFQVTNGGTYTQASPTSIGSSSSCSGNTALNPFVVPAAGQLLSPGNQATITVLRAPGSASGGGYSRTRQLTITGTISVATCSVSGTDVQTACNSLTWIDGNTYTANNTTATHTIVNGAVGGCDSIVTLDLTILNSATGTDVQAACNTFTWIDGNTYTTNNNSATHTIVNGSANGCDSIVTLDLTILNSATGTDVQTACTTFTWIDGNTYTASNNSATHTIVNGSANGCDSIVTLDLTILNSATGTDAQTACNTFTWIDGNTYTANNNTATHTILNGAASGCDSIVTLDLTILNNATGTDVQTACNTFTWIDGNTYTANNNTATFTILNGAASGCDSIVTLDLTILNNATGTDVQTACITFTWIDGNTYTANNNTATFTILNGAASGCDSIVTLDLTINTSTVNTITSTGLDQVTVNGQVYTASGTYTQTLSNSQGCDSVLSINVVLDFTGIAENSELNFYLLPNPATDQLIIQGVSAEMIETVAIFDASGKKVKNMEFVDTTIDITDLVQGHYFLILTTKENDIHRNRFVKK